MIRAPFGLTTQHSSAHRRLLIAPLSPIGLALASYLFFWGCVLLPPNVYKTIMEEPNWMFLDTTSIVFVTLCVLGYMAGVVLIKATAIGRPHTVNKSYLGRRAILFPLLAAFVLNLVSVSLIAKNTPNLFTAWFINGANAKTGLDATGALTQSLPLLYGICWWVLWQVMNREYIGGHHSHVLRSAFCGAFAAALATAIIKVARYDLMPMLIGTTLVYMTIKLQNKRVSILRYATFVGTSAIAVIILFAGFSWLRGADSQSVLLNSTAGYTVASYNRLAGVLNGQIELPYAGTGAYALRFLGALPLLHRWVGFGIPDPASVLSSEFTAVGAAGLDGRYIWPSAFGSVYSDMGWASPAYFFVIGMLSMWAWRRLRAGRATGALLYPWLAFSVLFWFGNNIVSSPQLVTLAGAAALLSVYERAIARRVRGGAEYGRRPAGTIRS